MRITLLILLWVALAVVPAHAQYWLKAASGESSLIPLRQGGSFNYNLTDARVGTGFTFNFVQSTGVDANGYPIIPDYSQLQVNLGVAVSDGMAMLFTKKEFHPAFDLGVDGVWQIEPKTAGYWRLFARLKGSAVERDYAVRDTADTARYQLDSRAEFGFGVGLGVNAAVGRTESVLFGLALTGKWKWNSTDTLDTRQVCIVDASAKATDGSTITVADCKERAVGMLVKLTSAQLRFDIAAELARPGKPGESVRVGMIAAISRDFDATGGALNLAVGPSLHPDDDMAQVLFATLLEVDDMFNERGKNPDFWDRFAVRLHVGVPFKML